MLYLRRIIDPLPIYKKLVLVLSFRQVQDRYEVIMALERGRKRVLVQYWAFLSVKTNGICGYSLDVVQLG